MRNHLHNRTRISLRFLRLTHFSYSGDQFRIQTTIELDLLVWSREFGFGNRDGIDSRLRKTNKYTVYAFGEQNNILTTINVTISSFDSSMAGSIAGLMFFFFFARLFIGFEKKSIFFSRESFVRED